MKAVITYHYRNFGVCGQTLGADGSGDKAVIIEGECMHVHNKIKELIDKMGPGYSNVIVVTDEEGYLGSPLTEYKV